jgi:hypothetical protein
MLTAPLVARCPVTVIDLTTLARRAGRAEAEKRALVSLLVGHGVLRWSRDGRLVRGSKGLDVQLLSRVQL